MLNKAASYFERAIKSNDCDGHTCFGARFDSWKRKEIALSANEHVCSIKE